MHSPLGSSPGPTTPNVRKAKKRRPDIREHFPPLKRARLSKDFPVPRLLSSNDSVGNQKRPLSGIERLPIEVLMPIFWQARNPNLAHTCRRLWQRLPKFDWYSKQQAVFAFCPFLWHKEHHVAKNLRSALGWLHDSFHLHFQPSIRDCAEQDNVFSDGNDELPETLQEEVLLSNWFTAGHMAKLYRLLLTYNLCGTGDLLQFGVTEEALRASLAKHANSIGLYECLYETVHESIRKCRYLRNDIEITERELDDFLNPAPIRIFIRPVVIPDALIRSIGNPKNSSLIARLIAVESGSCTGTLRPRMSHHLVDQAIRTVITDRTTAAQALPTLLCLERAGGRNNAWSMDQYCEPPGSRQQRCPDVQIHYFNLAITSRNDAALQVLLAFDPWLQSAPILHDDDATHTLDAAPDTDDDVSANRQRQLIFHAKDCALTMYGKDPSEAWLRRQGRRHWWKIVEERLALSRHPTRRRSSSGQFDWHAWMTRHGDS